MTRKQVDDVLGGDEAWKHADSTTGVFDLTNMPLDSLRLTKPEKQPAQNATMVALTSISCRLDPLTNP